MSDRFWAKISIGGDVPESLLEDLYNNIVDDIGVDSVKDDKQTYKSWFKEQLQNNILDFEDGEACYGRFEDLEAFLIDNDIPYIRESSAYGEFSPEVVYFNGKEMVTQEANQDGVPIISVQTVKDWCKRASELHEEFKMGIAPTFIDASPQESTIDGIMAKYSLAAKQEPSSALLVLAVLNSQYPSIEQLPPFKIIKG